jgi:alpha-galactosidase
LTIVAVDDCWSEQTGRVDGHIVPNATRFPDGIDGLADKIHGMGLKFGIYSSESSLPPWVLKSTHNNY